jgi:phosphatidate phosphatase PAH1
MGREMVRVEREESYLRNFKSLSLGRLKLSEGANQLELYAQGIKKSDDLEIYMITLQRL